MGWTDGSTILGDSPVVRRWRTEVDDVTASGSKKAMIDDVVAVLNDRKWPCWTASVPPRPFCRVPKPTPSHYCLRRVFPGDYWRARADGFQI